MPINSLYNIKSLVKTLQFIINHPLNINKRSEALRRWLFWQIGARLVSGPVMVDFVNEARLVVRPGMTGATQNVYCGLQEFEEMGFLLHYLSKDDLFVDVGANVGAYTILSAAVIGARAIAVEPIPSSFRSLEENIIINRVQDLVELKNIGISNKSGLATFTASLDTMNHISKDTEESINRVMCKVDTLDSILKKKVPKLLKIDVEGHEFAVIEGAQRTLHNQSLEAIIIELNGNGMRYGYDDLDLYKNLVGNGFTATRYSPFERELVIIEEPNKLSQNTLFVRSPAEAAAMCQRSPSFKVVGHQI